MKIIQLTTYFFCLLISAMNAQSDTEKGRESAKTVYGPIATLKKSDLRAIAQPLEIIFSEQDTTFVSSASLKNARSNIFYPIPLRTEGDEAEYIYVTKRQLDIFKKMSLKGLRKVYIAGKAIIDNKTGEKIFLLEDYSSKKEAIYAPQFVQYAY